MARPPDAGSSLKSDPRGRQPALVANGIWAVLWQESEARGGGGVMLCEHMRGRGDGDELPEDVLGHLNIVLCNHQCLLDVLVGVALTHQVLDLRAHLRVGVSSCCSATWGGGDRRDRAVPALRVHPSGQGLRGSLRGFRRLREGCRNPDTFKTKPDWNSETEATFKKHKWSM